MKARLDRKTKILTAAVLCASTTLWASPVWAESGGSAIKGAYYGGTNTAVSGKVEGKTVTVETGDNFKGVYGGYAFKENWGEPDLEGASQANNNTVIIKGGNVTGENIGSIFAGIKAKVAGGWGNYTSGNMVTLEDGNIETSVYGGYSMVSGNEDNNNHPIISGNKVNVNGGTIIGGDIAGAYVTSDGANGNKNTIENNAVTINGGQITTDSRGDYGNIYGAFSDDRYAVLNSNKVIINDGNIKTESSSLGGIYGAYASKRYNSANSNEVYINGGRIEGDVFGAFANTAGYYNKEHGSVENNKVIITGGTIIGNVYAGVSDEGTGQKNNSIEISGNKANLSQTNLYGWKANDDPDNAGIKLNVNNFVGHDNNGEIKFIENFNNVNIKNSKIKVESINYVDEINVENKNQYVVKLGTINKSSAIGVYGFYGTNITTDSKIEAQSLENINYINVDMTAINWEKDTAVIDVSGTADLTGTDISATGTLAAAAGTEVQNGDTMSFIKAGTLTGATANDIDISNLQIGFAAEAQVEVQDRNNSIDFVVTGGKQATKQVSIIGESRTAAIAFVNQGSDILNNAFGLMDDGKYGIKTFAAAHGNYSKYETGSHIRVNGWSMLAGVGSSEKVNDGTFSWGVFFENGSGNYRTYNDYNGFNLEGFGSAVYNGGGALARYRSNAGNYAEVGVRAGMLKNSLGNAVADGYGVQGGYDEETSYYGAHLGVGHIFAVDENSNVDVYGKYFYNHHESEDLNILGDEVRFDSADSNRLRLGLRYNQNDGNAFSHYYGLAWDYEFNGDANVTAAGFDTGNPSLKGSTAVIEAGIHYAPDNSPWSIDLGLQGYGGQRDGFSGTMQLNYSFN